MSNVFRFRPALVGVLLAALCLLTVDHMAVAQTSTAEDSEWDDPGDSSITRYEVLRRNLAVHAPGQFVTIDSNTGSHETSEQSNYVRADTPAAPSVAQTEAGNGVRQVLPDAESTDANLSALSVGGESVAGFDAETTSYQFGVANTVSQVTVAGVAANADATVAYSGTDADGADGHQVDLSVGRNDVTVTVTASDGVSTRDYTVSVNRGSDAPFGWKAEDDFDTLEAAENVAARGIWSDGTTMWVGDDENRKEKLFAYTLATKQRNPDEDFNTHIYPGNTSIRGIWSDGATMWVVDYNSDKAFAYVRPDVPDDVNMNVERDQDNDFLAIRLPMQRGPYWVYGLWSDGRTIWISDPVFDGIYAYNLVDRQRDPDKDIDPALGDGNARSGDLWSDGTTMWVSDRTKLFAYALDTGQRDSVRDFVALAVENTSPAGIWSNGTTMWVSDRFAGKIHAYNMPGNPDLSALSLSAGTLTPTLTPNFHRVTKSYAASVEHSVSTITVTATAVDAGNATVEFLDAADMPLVDADIVNDGQQVNLVVGDNTIKVKVTADDGVVTRTSTMIVTREPLSTDLSALSVDGKSVAGFDADTTSYQFGVANTVTQVTVAGVALDVGAAVTYSGTDANGADGHQVDLSVGRNVVTVTVADRDGGNTRDYTVSINRGSDAPFGWKAEDDFDTLKAAGNIDPSGIWSNGTIIWVVDDEENKLYAYALATGQHNAGRDFDALEAADNTNPRGIWSNGTTMWVSDRSDEEIYAYALATGRRDADKDIDSLVSAGNTAPVSIWSDRTTMWVADPEDDEIYAYTLASGEEVAGRKLDTLNAANNRSPRGIWSDRTTMWVADEEDDKLYAYELATGQRDAVRDFDDLAAAGNNDPRGIWSNGTTMWVVDWRKAKLYAYNMPGNPDLSALSISAGTSTPTWSPSFQRLTTAYAVSVANSASTITVTATAVDAANATVEFLDDADMPLLDADSVTDGQQVNLVVGDKTIKVKVTAGDGVVTRIYTLTVTREAPAPVSFGSSSYSVGEGESVTVTVSLDQALSGQVVVPLNVTDGSGISGSDYSGVPASVTFAAGAMSATFSFSAGDDDLVEADEDVTVAFGTLPEAVIEGSPATTTVTITNDDVPNWALSATRASITEAAVSSSTVSVSSGGVTFSSEKTINLGFAGTATKGTDYTVADETLTLAAGRSSVSTTVSALDDSELDVGETILVTATLGGSTIGTQQLITVVDDEQAATSIVLEVSPSAVGEGAGAATLTVEGTLDGAGLTTDTVVSLTLAAGTATEGDDYTVGSATATLTIAARAVSGTASFRLTPVDDRIDDDDETVTIAASSTSTLPLSPASLTVTITDNDEPNNVPVFDPATLTRLLEENSGAGVAVGAAVTATDADDDTLSYSLEGTDAGSFRIDSASGQISTAPGVTYDHEASGNSYVLTVTADDSRGGEASATVTIEITDVDEPPPPPAAPSVSPTRGETDSLDVSWIAPSMTGRPDFSGYKVRYSKGSRWADWPHTGTGIVATIDGLDPDTSYDVQVRAINDEGESGWSPPGDGSTFAIDDPCLEVGPTPTVVAVTSVPIVVPSTTDVYFVLYVTHRRDGAEVWTPVAVTWGKTGTTTLGENVEALPYTRYRVEQYDITDPADIDGDCDDDLSELAALGRMNPLNAAPAILRNDGAVAIPDGDTFEELSYTEPGSDYEYVKFALLDMDTDHPLLYFINSTTHLRHPVVLFLDAIGHTNPDLPWAILGEIVYDPDLVAADGTQGVYYFWLNRYDGRYTFDLLDRAHTMLTAAMPLLGDNMPMYIPNHRLPGYQAGLETLRASRIPLLFNEDVFPDTDFLALNSEVGFGLLRVMDPGERPSPLNIVIYESLPNELPRVGGIITTVPQTPLSHVNLRAVQDSVPNAYIKDALGKDAIDALIDSYVRYEVTADGYELRAATLAEVNAHHAASRPARAQVPERDLSVTEITPLSDIGFDDWRAFGVKAANVAVLGTLGFTAGTVPEGFAIPFYFYDEFMKNAVLAAEKVFGKGQGAEEDRFTLPAGTKLIAAVEAILIHPRFQADFEIQDEMLDDLREVIEEAESPQWMIDALTAMHAEVLPAGRSLRYRSSTNNEDLPGFSGAGLYDSNTQKQSETENEGIDKSMKQVFAGLWNYRAFIEREFHRIDHLATAMGVLVHPNYSDELANGVAASFDPISGLNSYYYLNSQLGEDLVTNPDASSEPEEILLHKSGDFYEILATSNQVEPGTLLMSDAQMKQLAEHLTAIHEKFEELYDPGSNQPFAIEIEFKITVANILAIKQARPWVFAAPNQGRQRATTIGTGGPGGSSGSGGGGGGGGDLDVGVAVFMVANGWSPPDVGVASVLAARTDGAVVVYTAGDELSAETALLLREASPAEVVIVGGIAAVSRDVRSQIRVASPDSGISRVTGADRADTAAGTARRILGPPAAAGRVTLIVANGWSPPDIGAAAALAARSGRSAVLYVRRDGLPDVSASALRDYDVARVVLIGGPAAISEQVHDAIAAAAGDASISRLTGTDRVDTAAQAARRVLGNPASAPEGITLVIANGWSPPDIGVAAALAAATDNSAVAYTAPSGLSTATAMLISQYRPSQVIIIGGSAAVANSVRAAITQAAPPSADVRRVTGSTRTDTAARAARRILADP
ncbi:cadherin-like beta sandwich domain-containing protein [Candidatus Poriferisodalis sp.]|uniref:cadherin-like beta sandwich domain-containing protein n=1 Tax=Candidatus Poriferisodalis sp. TaxID=3101277 RepID=UPI003C6F667C